MPWPGLPESLRRHSQDGVLAAERILDRLFGVRVGQPLAVHHEQILMSTGLHGNVADPSACADLRQGRGFRFPAVKITGDANLLGIRLHELEGYTTGRR